MAQQAIHPAATHHLPPFITAPGDTDVLMVVMAFVLIAATVGVGVLFFTLHSLPERIAHRGHKLQFEIVAVLCLIGLFTHNHAFWIGALLLALVDFPDVGGWLNRIAGSVEKIAGDTPGGGGAGATPDAAAASPPHDNVAPMRRSDGGAHAGADHPTHAGTRG
jgi:hypothetical protein